MRKFFLIMLLSLIGGSVGAEPYLHDYYSYQEFAKLNPLQEAIGDKFSHLVRQPVKQAEPKVQSIAKIAIIYPGIQASDYWRRSVSSFEARLRERKIPYEIHPFFTKPAREIRLQEKQIEQALKGDPDYLVFTLDALRHEETIQRLIKRGRPKVIVQNSTQPVKKWGKDQPFLYVGFDHVIGSQMLADKFMQVFPKRTEYAMFYGSNGFVSVARGNTFEHAVAKNHASHKTLSFHLDFDRERSRKAALHLFTRKKMPPFVFACSTDIALGVVDAAKEVGKLDKVAVNGWGGGGDELDALKRKEIDFTVMRMNDDNGVAMADAIYLDMTGRTADVPQIYSGDMILVDQNMPNSKIDALKQRAFRYSDRWQSDVNHILSSNGS